MHFAASSRQTTAEHSSDYQPHIDGLRAVAVLLVLAYHAFPKRFPGGFAGVDVFFVISGFLISGLIQNKIESGTFKYREFYGRRIRRIFPALFVVLVSSLGLGLVILYTGDFQELCKHITAAVLFLSNILLYNEAGYFDAASDTKPLLHLWSLGIEEQFYIIWPFIAFISVKLRKDIGIVILILLLMSLSYDIFLVSDDHAAAFYMPHARIFEILLGSGLSYANSRKITSDSFSSLTINFISICGLLLVLISQIYLNLNSPFPGYWALVPTIGAAAIIFSGSKTWVNRNIFSNPIMIFVGLISYPMYLWHWPLLVFLRAVNQQPPLILKLLALLLSVVLAWVTWRVVERPLRYGKSRRIVPILVGSMAGLAILAFSISQSASFSLRGMPGDADQLKWDGTDQACLQNVGLVQEEKHHDIFCNISKSGEVPAVAIIGDSIANSLYPGINEAYGKMGLSVINVGIPGCPPLRKVYGKVRYNEICDSVNEKIYDYIKRTKSIQTVIFGIYGADFAVTSSDKNMTEISKQNEDKNLRDIAKNDIGDLRSWGKSVVVNFDNPTVGDLPESCLGYGTGCDIDAKTVEPAYQSHIDEWASIFDNDDACIFRTTPILKTDGQYHLRKDGTLVFRDDHHLSVFGSHMVAAAFLKSDCFKR
jgi:peptidoglycan/LPS O-acetylase OafA/YrhL